MRTIPIRRFTVLAAVLAVASTVLMATDQRSRSERQLLVTALADASTPAKGLTATDFIVREDGLAREVVRVATAPPPSHVMVLVDDSQASERSIPFLRSGLAGFIARMGGLKPAPQLALMTFGERPTMRADFAPKADAVQVAAGTLFAVPGSGSYLLQALMDACKNLRKRTVSNPVIVAFAAETGPEFSNEHREQIADALKGAQASLWTIVLQDPARLDQTVEGRERSAVLGDVVTQSGGLARTILSDQSVEPAFDGVAALLASRYLVTYSRPDQLIPPTTVEVASTRDGVRMVATRWAR